MGADGAGNNLVISVLWLLSAGLAAVLPHVISAVPLHQTIDTSQTLRPLIKINSKIEADFKRVRLTFD